MPAYHSIFNSATYSSAYGIPLITVKTDKFPDLDPSKLKEQPEDLDIIDEAFIYFRANILFKSFSIKGEADKMLVYITVYIAKCLEVAAANVNDLEKTRSALKTLADDAEWSPNYKGHFMNNLVTEKKGEEAELQTYLKTIRKAVNFRLLYILYESESKTLDLKYWLGFAKRKFLGYEMPVFKNK
jgi:actin related protein 2/3 complex subunit 3